MIQFSNNLSKVRLQRGKSASEVADFLGISRMQYYRYEKDLTPVPAKVIVLLALYYHCEMFHLYWVCTTTTDP